MWLSGEIPEKGKTRESRKIVFYRPSHKQNPNNRNCAASMIGGGFSFFHGRLSRNHNRNQSSYFERVFLALRRNLLK